MDNPPCTEFKHVLGCKATKKLYQTKHQARALFSRKLQAPVISAVSEHHILLNHL